MIYDQMLKAGYGDPFRAELAAPEFVPWEGMMPKLSLNELAFVLAGGDEDRIEAERLVATAEVVMLKIKEGQK